MQVFDNRLLTEPVNRTTKCGQNIPNMQRRVIKQKVNAQQQQSFKDLFKKGSVKPLQKITNQYIDVKDTQDEQECNVKPYLFSQCEEEKFREDYETYCRQLLQQQQGSQQIKKQKNQEYRLRQYRDLFINHFVQQSISSNQPQKNVDVKKQIVKKIKKLLKFNQQQPLKPKPENKRKPKQPKEVKPLQLDNIEEFIDEIMTDRPIKIINNQMEDQESLEFVVDLSLEMEESNIYLETPKVIKQVSQDKRSTEARKEGRNNLMATSQTRNSDDIQLYTSHNFIEGMITVDCICCGLGTKQMCIECSTINDKIIGLCKEKICISEHYFLSFTTPTIVAQIAESDIIKEKKITEAGKVILPDILPEIDVGKEVQQQIDHKCMKKESLTKIDIISKLKEYQVSMQRLSDRFIDSKNEFSQANQLIKETLQELDSDGFENQSNEELNQIIQELAIFLQNTDQLMEQNQEKQIPTDIMDLEGQDPQFEDFFCLEVELN